jgi:hypothetical protein
MPLFWRPLGRLLVDQLQQQRLHPPRQGGGLGRYVGMGYVAKDGRYVVCGRCVHSLVDGDSNHVACWSRNILLGLRRSRSQDAGQGEKGQFCKCFVGSKAVTGSKQMAMIEARAAACILSLSVSRAETTRSERDCKIVINQSTNALVNITMAREAVGSMLVPLLVAEL